MSKILLFIPAYNCEKQLPRVLAKITPEVAIQFVEVIVVENRSSDNTATVAKETLVKIQGCKATLMQNNANYSLGGSHKVAFNYCIEKDYDYVIVLHGDDQGDLNDILPLIAKGEHTRYDCLLGARFAKGSKLIGYSKFRTFGNYVFNTFISVVTRTNVTDMGAGLNMYSSDFLRSKFYMSFANDLTFNVYMLYYTIWKRANFKFFPLTWNENDQVSNAKIFKQAKHILGLTYNYVIRPNELLAPKQYDNKEYSSTVLFQSDKQEN